MTIRVPELTGGGWVRHVEVSVPYAEVLLDGKKYRLPGAAAPQLTGTEGYRARAPRGPTLRSLVQLALKCDSAEQMGKQLKRRFDRSLRRRGIEPRRPSRQDELEVKRLLGQD